MTISPLPAGIKLGPYRLEKVYSLDRYCCIYIALDREKDEKVLIHELTPMELALRAHGGNEIIPLAGNERRFEEKLDQFLSFYDELTRLPHRHIGQTLGIYRVLGSGIAAQEFPSGISLPAYLEALSSGRTPSYEKISRMVRDMIEAIGFLHENRILHRHLSLNAVFVDRDDKAVIHDIRCPFDFDLHKNTTLVCDSQLMAPEILLDLSPYDACSEIYSLAVIFYFLLTGRQLQRADQRYYAGHATDLSETEILLAKYPEKLLKSIDKALDINPERRHRSIGEWITEI